MLAKVWVVGEGNNELGASDGYGTRTGGVLEALLVRVCERAWECAGKREWRTIQKFRAGGARLAGPGHGDYFNVLGLVLAAHEEAADVVAFSRDVDGDPDRERAVIAALSWIRDHSGWTISIVGGVAKPALEGWILALRGVGGTDSMSRARANTLLTRQDIQLKSSNDYVVIVEQATLGEPPHVGLPMGSDSLRSWLATAHEILNRVVRGHASGDEQE